MYNFNLINNIVLLSIFPKAPQELTPRRRTFLGSGARNIQWSSASFPSVIFDRPYIPPLVLPVKRKNLVPTESEQLSLAIYLASFQLYLFAILSSRRVERLNEICRVSKKKSVTCRTADHAEHSQPHVGQRLWRESAISDTQHMRHGFEEGPRILFQPKRVLQVYRHRHVFDHKSLNIDFVTKYMVTNSALISFSWCCLLKIWRQLSQLLNFYNFNNLDFDICYRNHSSDKATI